MKVWMLRYVDGINLSTNEIIGLFNTKEKAYNKFKYEIHDAKIAIENFYEYQDGSFEYYIKDSMDYFVIEPWEVE